MQLKWRNRNFLWGSCIILSHKAGSVWTLEEGKPLHLLFLLLKIYSDLTCLMNRLAPAQGVHTTCQWLRYVPCLRWPSELLYAMFYIQYCWLCCINKQIHGYWIILAPKYYYNDNDTFTSTKIIFDTKGVWNRSLGENY